MALFNDITDLNPKRGGVRTPLNGRREDDTTETRRQIIVTEFT